mgnify:CR=1 FL=1
MKRKIAVVTGTRAEYGLLYWLIRQVHESSSLELQLIVTGSHLSPEFGNTLSQIEEDHFPIVAKVEMLLSSDTPVGIAKSMGLGVIGFADALDRLRPDIMVLLGDRYEILAAAQAAMIARIPMTHIHGGELTEGLIDEAIRHAVTKMSHLHFTAAEPYRQRVIQLGEQPDHVFNVGAIGLDNIVNLPLMEKEALEHSIDFSFGEMNFLVTYHPVTLTDQDPGEEFRQLLVALERFPKAKLIITKPNADTYGRRIHFLIDEYAAENPDRVLAVVSLGQLRYLSALQFIDAVIGNSSSALIEVPLFRKPSINIGDRQKGRICGETVVNCGTNADEIESAIRYALSPVHRDIVSKSKSLFGEGGTSQKIVDILKSIDLNQLIIKRFYDLER